MAAVTFKVKPFTTRPPFGKGPVLNSIFSLPAKFMISFRKSFVREAGTVTKILSKGRNARGSSANAGAVENRKTATAQMIFMAKAFPSS
jgi:hypothetical protein